MLRNAARRVPIRRMGPLPREERWLDLRMRPGRPYRVKGYIPSALGPRVLEYNLPHPTALRHHANQEGTRQALLPSADVVTAVSSTRVLVDYSQIRFFRNSRPSWHGPNPSFASRTPKILSAHSTSAGVGDGRPLSHPAPDRAEGEVGKLGMDGGAASVYRSPHLRRTFILSTPLTASRPRTQIPDEPQIPVPSSHRRIRYW